MQAVVEAEERPVEPNPPGIRETIPEETIADMATNRTTYGLRRRRNRTSDSNTNEDSRNNNVMNDGVPSRALPGGGIHPNERTVRNTALPSERPAPARTTGPTWTSTTAWKVSQWYCWVSALGALLAILMAPSTTTIGASWKYASPNSVVMTSGNSSPFALSPSSVNASPKTPTASEHEETAMEFPPIFRWITQHILLPPAAKEDAPSAQEPPKKNASPWWIFWSNDSPSPHEGDASLSTRLEKHSSWSTSLLSSFMRIFLFSWIDPNLIPPINKHVDTIITDLIDKVLTSTIRIVFIANWLIALTVLLHTAVADYFLGHRRDRVHSRRRTDPEGGGTPVGGGGEGENPTTTTNEESNTRRNSRTAPHSPSRDRVGGFLIFKFLLISAMVAPDTFDLLILLSWYTVLSFLRSLASLCAQQTDRARLWQQIPTPGVLQLLLWVLFCDGLAALTCIGLFHGAGTGMVLLLTCDCLLLALDGITHIIQYYQSILDGQHANQVQVLEERQLELHRPMAAQVGPSIAFEERARNLDQEIEVLEQQHVKKTAVMDTMIFVLQLWTDLLTTAHFLHIWTLHGIHFTFIDGVIALHLHSAILSALKKISERRAMHRIAREMDEIFTNATEMDLQKASATGDVCCICLGTMSFAPEQQRKDRHPAHVKKVACGHLYHTTCLREVIERARSIEAARCPLCRAFFVPRKERAADPHPSLREGGGENELRGIAPGDRGPAPDDTTAAVAVVEDERALFRFTTEGLFPAWLPLPAFSFEVVRRPLVPDVAVVEERPNVERRNDEANPPEQSLFRRFLLLTGAVPMSPAEELAALEQLVDMFPQYDRLDLQRALRERGSIDAVVESILLGAFVGIPRGMGDAR